jgi:hypothetical protein
MKFILENAYTTVTFVLAILIAVTNTIEIWFRRLQRRVTSTFPNECQINSRAQENLFLAKGFVSGSPCFIR